MMKIMQLSHLARVAFLLAHTQVAAKWQQLFLSYHDFLHPNAYLSQKKTRQAGFLHPKNLLRTAIRMGRYAVHFARSHYYVSDSFMRFKSAAAIYILALVITLFGIFRHLKATSRVCGVTTHRTIHHRLSPIAFLINYTQTFVLRYISFHLQ